MLFNFLKRKVCASWKHPSRLYLCRNNKILY